MKYIILSVLTLGVLSGCGQTDKNKATKQSSATTQSNSIAKNVSGTEVKEIIAKKDIQILDVRTKEETAAGMLSGALNLDFYDPEFLQKTEVLDKNKPVLVYCAAGGRSAQAMQKMKNAGFKEIYNASEGYGAIK